MIGSLSIINCLSMHVRCNGDTFVTILILYFNIQYVWLKQITILKGKKKHEKCMSVRKKREKCTITRPDRVRHHACHSCNLEHNSRKPLYIMLLCIFHVQIELLCIFHVFFIPTCSFTFFCSFKFVICFILFCPYLIPHMTYKQM